MSVNFKVLTLQVKNLPIIYRKPWSFETRQHMHMAISAWMILIVMAHNQYYSKLLSFSVRIAESLFHACQLLEALVFESLLANVG